MRKCLIASLLVLIMASPAQLFADAWREEIEREQMEQERPLIEAAREDVNAFIEYAFGLTQAPIHSKLQAHWDEFDRTVDLFPIEHGKTTQTIGRILHIMGRRPDLCGAYVSSGDGPAQKVARAVRRAIEQNDRVRRVFPHLLPETDDKGIRTWWGADGIRVAGARRDGLDKEPTFAAYTWNGQISGARLDWIFIDNVCNSKNVYSAGMRERLLDAISNDVLSRAVDGARVHVTDTSWYDDDPPHQLGKRDGWDMLVVDAEIGEDGQTAWPEQWPMERLEKKRLEIGQTAYDRTLRNITTAASAGIFKRWAFEQQLGTAKWRTGYDGRRRVVTGVDLGTRPGAKHDLTVFTTGVDVDGVRYQVLHQKAIRATGTDLAKVFVDIYRRFHAGRGGGKFIVEDNGAQQFIIDMLRAPAFARAAGFTTSELSRLHVQGRTTTAKKHDLDTGVQSVAADLEMSRILLPDHPEIGALWEEMRVYAPEDHTGDRLMSLWIMREGLRRRTSSMMVEV